MLTQSYPSIKSNNSGTKYDYHTRVNLPSRTYDSTLRFYGRDRCAC